MNSNQEPLHKNVSELKINSEMGLAQTSKEVEWGIPEAAKKMAQLYRYGQGVERDICAAIDWQKKYRDLLKAQYADVHDDNIHVLIEAENDLAEMELENGRIKDARNTCWRGIYLCRAYGRGSFYSASRIPYYAKLYMLLGDVFLQRRDENQALECYQRDMPIYTKLAEENPDNILILTNTCRCFFKLYQLNPQYNEHSFETVLGYLQLILTIHYDIDVLLLLAKCYKVIGDNKSRDKAKTYYEQSASICSEIVKEHKTADALSALSDAFLSLCKWYANNRQIKESESYLQKALTVCKENIHSFKSDAGYYDILRCYYLEVEVLRQYDSKKDYDHQSSKISPRLSELNDKVQQVLSVIDKEYPGPKTDFFLFKSCAVFYELSGEEKVMESYERVLSLVRDNPVKYYDNYRCIKQALWRLKKLDWKVYQNNVVFNVSRSEEEYGSYEVFNRSKGMELSVSIVGERPSGRIVGILISEDVLLENRSCYSENPYAYRSSCFVQICKADSDFSQYGRKDPTPDEYVYLLVETSSSSIEEVECIRCYG